MSTLSLITTAAESSGGSEINPYAVGAISLIILLAMLGGLMMFGRGRDHT
ncbi:MAG TPA: hypothetical protein VFM50_02045 [Nocardioidaceae bacterium]|jgi:hypothetical protein|nr:hypothetical protein [Nocardioidaceae bacterium]HET8716504.1 hypothetical protein [Nocardioidaceae bacterium]